MRTAGDAIVRRFGDAMMPATRAAVMDVLTAMLPRDALRLGVAATGLEPGLEPGGGSARPVLLTQSGVMPADLIVAADGVNSALRKALFPEHPGPVFSGFTAWRMLVPAPPGTICPGRPGATGRSSASRRWPTAGYTHTRQITPPPASHIRMRKLSFCGASEAGTTRSPRSSRPRGRGHPAQRRI
ncbi:hypothetical protein ACFQ9X_53840 [Catenulispora yoronensis]